ncbi:MAG: Holliday junction resolvase RecU [Bacilli bacterium]|jgi:recombination protein U|nr:Holliday junction resolvase RecU [Bacilli bacterium]
MGKLVKYPDGSVREIEDKKKKKEKDFSKSNLGSDFETEINESNDYYRLKQIAVIHKKPTPVQIVKVDYPARNKAKIVEAYYKTPSTTDYNGIYKEKYIDFEAKSCRELNFSFERIYDHQIRHLEQIDKMGGISFLIIEFSSIDEVYILPAKLLVEKYEESLNGGRKSIPYDYIKDNGVVVERGFAPRLAYLKAVDKYYFKKK